MDFVSELGGDGKGHQGYQVGRNGGRETER